MLTRVENLAKYAVLSKSCCCLLLKEALFSCDILARVVLIKHNDIVMVC